MDTLLAKALGQDPAQLATDEKQRLLSRLLGRLAHEIRNPLSSLDIHVQLLEEDLGVLAPETREKLAGRLEIIHGELKRLENLVKHFLRLSAPSELNLEMVDIRRLVTNVCELLGPEAKAREIRLQSISEADLPTLMADPAQLTQVLMNLVINALQAVGPGGEVKMQAQVADESLFILVQDNGPGIPPDKLADIFMPYFTTKPDGSGLGLWIAQQIARAHDGELQAANAPGGGAVFSLRLPIRKENGVHG